MNTNVSDKFYIIKNIKSNKFFQYIPGTFEELKMMIQSEKIGKYFVNHVFCKNWQEAYRSQNINKINKIYNWLDKIEPNNYSIIKVEVKGSVL